MTFGPFTLDPGAFALRRDGVAVKLERRPMELLLLLAAQEGRLVTREQIADRLWGSAIHVEIDMGIHTAIRKLRRALGDVQACIETVPGKGYRFVAMPAAVAAPPPAGARVVIAVLPFDIFSANPADAYIAAGLTDETIASLGQIDPERLAVIGRTSAAAARSTARTLADIGRDLGAGYLVEGSVRVEGGRLRVTCTLIEAPAQRQVWAASLDAEPLSMLAFQRELAATIAAQIQMRLSDSRAGVLERRQTRDPAAYDLFLRGRHLANQHKAGINEQAVACFAEATVADPSYALAWAGIAETLAASPINADVPHGAVAERARGAAARALQAGADLAEVQTAAAFVQFWLDWDWQRAETSLRAATLADPNYAIGHRMLGIVLAHLGLSVEARETMARGRALEPLQAQMHALSAQVAFYARDFAAAIGHARQALVVEPGFWIGHWQLAQACAEAGQAEQAVEILERLRRGPGGNSKVLGLQGHVLAVLGRTEEACARLAHLAEAARSRFVPPYASALIHAGLGDADAALAALEAAFAVRDVHLAFLPQDPKWDALRADPRFTDLVARCGFTGVPRPRPRLRAVGG